DLIVEAEAVCDTSDVFLRRIYQNMVMLRDNIGPDRLSPDLLNVATKFRNVLRPSIATQSDAIVKQISAIPWLAETQVALEELGYSPEQITRLMSEKRRAQGQQRLAAMLAAGASSDVVPSSSGDS